MRAPLPILVAWLCICFCVCLGACTAPAVTDLCDNANPAQEVMCRCPSSISDLVYDDRVRREIDVLLVIDNSPGMADKQKLFAQTLGSLLPSLEVLDYHIGVVTTDVGSWTAPNRPFATPFPGCDSFAGDDGKLQVEACLDRKNLSAAAARACSDLCRDRRFLPANGARFITNRSGQKNVPEAMEIDPVTGWPIDRGPQYALQCMALVGDSGCALVSPLEAMKRALDGHLAENSGFLRPNAMLAVVIVTDKEDCSVSNTRRADSDPRSRNCTIVDDNAPLDCFNPAFRCLARGLRCDQPIGTTGAKSGCRERDGDQLAPIAEYARFLQSFHIAEKTTFLGVWPLPSLLDGEPLIVEQLPTQSGSEGLVVNRGRQLRLSSMARMLSSTVRPPREVALEDPEQLREALRSALDPQISCRWGASCFPAPPRRFPDGSPICVAGFVPEETPLAVPETPLPLCGARCCTALLENPRGCAPTWPFPVAEHCRDEAADCYCIGNSSESSTGGSCHGQAAVAVFRKGNRRSPPDSVVNIRCATTGLHQRAPSCYQ